MFKSYKKLFLTQEDIENKDNLLRIINQLQNNIKSSFDPLTSNLQNDSTFLPDIHLVSGQTNIINHKLDRNLTGWKVIKIDQFAILKDQQSINPSPNLTLWLETNLTCNVSLEVF